MGKQLASFPKKQILTREQARFIIWCLTYDRIQQKAGGFRYHSYGLLTKLAKTFGVTRECIVQINKRRTWRNINRPKPKQLFFAKKQDQPGMLPRDAIQRAQDFFHKEANEALEYYEWLRTLLGQEMTKEESEEAADEDTRLTRVFTGRPARALRNRLIDEMGDAEALEFPAQASLTRRLWQGKSDAPLQAFLPLWAGQAAPLIRDLPAATLIDTLVAECRPRLPSS
jgi:hypothetical protein